MSCRVLGRKVEQMVLREIAPARRGSRDPPFARGVHPDGA